MNNSHFDRVCIFVDAGYFYDQGSIAMSGKRHPRTALLFNPEEFFTMFIPWVEEFTNGRVHRVYWYDGARNMVPDDKHIAIDSQPLVKLRLGRLTHDGGQKGVDTLIVRDLMVLSQERTIQQAVVVTGDDDLREGIEYAQDRGVLVHLVGIRDSDGLTSQSEELCRIVDKIGVLEKSSLSSLAVGKNPQSRSESSVRTETDTFEQTEIPPEVLAKRVANAMFTQVSRDLLEKVLNERPGMLTAELDRKMFSLAWAEYGRNIYFEEAYKRTLRNRVREHILNHLDNS
jgi:hypothetical protein